MRLINADALLERFSERGVLGASIRAVINEAPTVDAVDLPCPIGSDCWWVDFETMEVRCEKGGITGFVVLKDEILALDSSGERMELHTEWCCLTREEAEAFRERMLKERE